MPMDRRIVAKAPKAGMPSKALKRAYKAGLGGQRTLTPKKSYLPRLGLFTIYPQAVS
jgi:hypothetical protein